jgi:hypothetical protein
VSNFFDGSGAFLGSVPIRPQVGKDLGEFGSSGHSGGGYTPGSGTQMLPSDATLGNYWARSNGVLFPATIGDNVAIGQYGGSYGAKLSVNGNIAALGYLLSDLVHITKDSGNNLVLTDVISGSHTLSELLSTGGGDVMISGTPVANQLAQWVSGNAIKGLDISALTLTQSQITGLVTALAGKASLVHNLVDTTNHPVTGLTPGYVLTAITPTSYAFAASAGATSLWKEIAGILSPLPLDAVGVEMLGITLSSELIEGIGDVRIRAAGISKNIIIQPGDWDGSYTNPGKILLGGSTSHMGQVEVRAVGASTTSLMLTTNGGGIMMQNDGSSDMFWMMPGYFALLSSIIYFGVSGLGGTLSGLVGTFSNGHPLVVQGGDNTMGNFNGGDLKLYGGKPFSAGTVGKVFIGTGSAGTNPLPAAGVDDTYMLTYNPTTGQISCMAI